jgi:hypothetical protein
VDVDSGDTATFAARDRDVDPSAVGAAQVEQVRRGAMRENGPRAACKYGGHVPAAGRQELGRRQRVDTAMDAVEPPGCLAFADRGGRQTERSQLLQSEHTVLDHGQPSNLGI